MVSIPTCPVLPSSATKSAVLISISANKSTALLQITAKGYMTPEAAAGTFLVSFLSFNDHRGLPCNFVSYVTEEEGHRLGKRDGKPTTTFDKLHGKSS